MTAVAAMLAAAVLFAFAVMVMAAAFAAAAVVVLLHDAHIFVIDSVEQGVVLDGEEHVRAALVSAQLEYDDLVLGEAVQLLRRGEEYVPVVFVVDGGNVPEFCNLSLFVLEFYDFVLFVKRGVLPQLGLVVLLVLVQSDLLLIFLCI